MITYFIISTIIAAARKAAELDFGMITTINVLYYYCYYYY